MNRSFLSVAVLMAAAGCSFSAGGQSPEDAGEELIEGELAELLELELSGAACDAPAEDEPGKTFNCTATDAGGSTVTFEGVVEDDDEIYVSASNVVVADDMQRLEQEAAVVLAEQIGREIDPADVDCPDETTVLDGDALTCEITDATNGDRYSLTATFGGFVVREGYADRFYEIGELIE